MLVDKAYDNGITVVPVPGACAAVNALIASGLPTRRFSFEAFLPQDKKERRAVLAELSHEKRTIIIYEAPHRLTKTLAELADVFGEDRRLTICKELTKKHESFNRTTFKEAIGFFSEQEPRGEYALVIEGMSDAEEAEIEQEKWKDISIEEHITQKMAEGMTKKDAIKAVAEERGIPKRDVYSVGMKL